MSKDFFDEPFDDETLLKLELYEAYLNEWLPVFISTKNPYTNRVNIFDFFSGAGTDSLGVPGSPLIAINSVNTERYISEIEEKKLLVTLYFNDYEKKYIKRLTAKINEMPFSRDHIKIQITNLEFRDAYTKLLPEMKGAANLIFLDQFGVDCVTKYIFQKFVKSPMTDLLFFISSSHFNRFHSHETFKKVLNFSKEELKAKSFFHIHNIVLEKYREFVPSDMTYHLAPFSIKKSSTINGLIFGSRHILGIEKFLKVCWSRDKHRGEANFDIDGEKLEMGEGSLFPSYYKPRKLQLFEDNLEKMILSGKIKNDKELYIYSIQNGFLPSLHAKPLLKDMKTKKKTINYSGQLGYTYSTVIRPMQRIPKPINRI